jgi:lysophospholipase L1-like esterase
MRRLTQGLLIALCVMAALWLVPKVRTGVPKRFWTAINRLSRTSYGSHFTDIPWPAALRSYDAAELLVYHDANLRLAPYVPGRVVFLGDSITARWLSLFPSQFFPGKPYINRGIGGQVTRQMIWRFHQDVVELHPDAVVILAGTNDIAFDKPLEATEKNVEIMVEMAQRHGIRVLLCSVPPLSMPDPASQARADRQLLLLNDWLRSYAARQHLSLIDYHSAFVDSSGRMSPSLSLDGIHPNRAGYALMSQLAQQAISSKSQP